MNNLRSSAYEAIMDLIKFSAKVMLIEAPPIVDMYPYHSCVDVYVHCT